MLKELWLNESELKTEKQAKNTHNDFFDSRHRLLESIPPMSPNMAGDDTHTERVMGACANMFEKSTCLVNHPFCNAVIISMQMEDQLATGA